MKFLMLMIAILLLTGCSFFKPLERRPADPADSTLETPVSIPTPATPSSIFQPAIDIFLKDQADRYLGLRLGLITNQTGVDAGLNSNRQRLLAAGLTLEVLFAPEHGIDGSIEAGLKVEDRRDHLTGLPVKSLYGIHTEADALAGLDVVIYDIQDIGIRPYTYISTLLRVMEASAAAGIEVIVLDRPNPLGGMLLEGSPLEEEFISFIGIAPIPYVYGLTAGELARYFKREMRIDCDLTVIRMAGWQREQHFGDLPLTWVPTSPNLPQWETAYYCATTGGIGELGQFNLGVGTPLPFQVIGAPWLDPYRLIGFLEEAQLPGVRFLPHFYRPTWGKFAEEFIPGVLIRITDFKTYQPYLTQLHLLYFLYQMYPEHNLFRTAVASKVQMFDKAMGSDTIRLALEAGATPGMILRDAKEDLQQFRRIREQYLMYP
jgi:uncharacterized protein YbbC (DUF1343 family)